MYCKENTGKNAQTLAILYSTYKLNMTVWKMKSYNKSMHEVESSGK